MRPENTTKGLPLPLSWLLQSAIYFRRRKNLAVLYKTDLVVITPKNLFSVEFRSSSIRNPS